MVVLPQVFNAAVGIYSQTSSAEGALLDLWQASQVSASPFRRRKRLLRPVCCRSAVPQAAAVGRSVREELPLDGTVAAALV